MDAISGFAPADGGKLGRRAAKIDADFTAGGVYVGISRPIEADRDFREVRFWAKSDTCGGLTFRLVDATGQSHQQRPKFPADSQWHEVVITTFDKGPGYQFWGGAADRKWHGPAKSVAFNPEKANFQGGKGTLWLDGVAAGLDERRIVPDLAIRPVRLGNVFLTAEPVRIGLDTKGDSIAWRITDFRNRLAAEGTAVAADGNAALAPPPLPPGYYHAALEARKGGQPLAKGATSFAIVEPIDLAGLGGPAKKPFGVMTHFAQGWDVDILPLVARCGIGAIRDEHYWAQVETAAGKFAFPAKSDRYMAAAEALGIQPLVVLSFENPLYDGGLTPHTPEGRAAFGRYAQAVLDHYGKQIRWLEVWNEYNGTWCKGPAAADRPRSYAEFIQPVYQAIKARRPDVQVLGCATVLVPMPYLEGIFRHGGLKHMDAVVVHPYRGEPEGVEEEIAELQESIRKHNGGQDKPVWATEVGRWDRGGRAVRVCWATEPAHVALRTSGPVTVYDMMGRPDTLHPAAGEVSLTLGRAPIYVEGDVQGIVEGGRFALAGRQSVDVLSEAALAYSLDGTGLDKPPAGRIEVLGAGYAIAAGAGAKQTGRIVLTGQDTSRPAVREYDYRLTMDGKLAGLGTVALEVIDPLRFRQPPRLVGGDVLRLRLANDSPNTAYTISGLRWKLGVQEGRREVSFAVPAAHGLAVDVRVNAPPAYRTCPVELGLDLAGRSPLSARGEASDNPCPNRTIRADGDLADWGQSASIDLRDCGRAVGKVEAGGTAWMAWDGKGFHLAAEVRDRDFHQPFEGAAAAEGDCLQFALAAAGWAPGGAWQEFLAALTPAGARLVRTLGPDGSPAGAVEGAAVAIRRDGDRLVYELSIPWSALRPIAPAEDGEFRLALAIHDTDGKKRDGWIEFGGGIRMGKSPDVFRICRFVSAEAGRAEMTAAVEPLPASPPAGAAERLLADSADDYGKHQGQAGWSYGHYNGDGKGGGDGAAPSGPYTDDDFADMKHVETPWGYNWSGPSQHCTLNRDAAHPGAQDGRPVWAVRRWRSTTAGQVRIHGRFRQTNAKSDGTGGRILIDGVQVYEALASAAGGHEMAGFDLVVTLKKGSLVDFAVTPGPGTSIDFDATEFRASIWLVAP